MIVALITGASSGIGLEYARQLAAGGRNLLIVSNEEKIATVATELAQEYSVQVCPLCMDLSLSDAAQQLFDYCTNENLEVDVLINNAGIFSFKEVIETDILRLETMMRLHISTPTMLCRLFVAKMLESKMPCYILNMSSMSAFMPNPFIALYAASKLYLYKFSRALQMELRDSNVSVSVICPGAVATNLYGFADNSRYMKLGLQSGIIMPVDRLVKKALHKMFKRKKKVIPGKINYLFIFLMWLIPDCVLHYAISYIRKKA
ncbi:MAG: SDR family NAD(P)-dependent oxidoreductase [Bacteroidales bacterium]|jgi:short-subunit dehydrogenase|nr:SDR family NAD(P)-dependent oxidoreductase [Bacteroidales bacterium]